MNIQFAVAVAVMLLGLVYLLAARKFYEVFYAAWAMGLLASLLRFGGEASLHLR